MNADNARRVLVGDRLNAIRGILEERGASGVLLSTRKNFAWATGGGENHVALATDAGVAGLLVTRDEAVVLTAVNEAPRIADEEVSDLPIEVRALPWHDEAAMTGEAQRVGGPNFLDDVALEDVLLPLRCRLSEFEMERMRWLADRMMSAVSAALSETRPGMAEHEVAANASHTIAAHGIRSPVLLAAADDRIDRYRHPLPTGRRIQRRLMLVLVAERWGLHVAVTRFVELQPLVPDLTQRTEAVNSVHEAMVTATRPGQTLGDVIAAAQAAYAESGYPDEWQLHHQGGIIGYQGRERIAVPGDATVIRSDTAFAWNPSVAGAKAEETMLLHRDGPEALTTAGRHP